MNDTLADRIRYALVGLQLLLGLIAIYAIYINHYSWWLVAGLGIYVCVTTGGLAWLAKQLKDL